MYHDLLKGSFLYIVFYFLNANKLSKFNVYLFVLSIPRWDIAFKVGEFSSQVLRLLKDEGVKLIVVGHTPGNTVAELQEGM